ncbi:MAG: flagellar basal body L-ring protein FlgH [Porticoccaceae bacterium]|jgi:flagellar L-ring protein precursor FlgH
MIRTLSRLLIGPLLLAVAGCAGKPLLAPAESPTVAVVHELPEVETNGSIYQQRRGYMPLFEDLRPRRVGDIITIVLNEQVSASKNSSSSANRAASGSLILDQLPDKLDDLAKLGFDLSGDQQFSGGGGSRANNTFTGTITVSVQDVMANGNLRVAGEKQIAINHGTEYIRFSGVVNPRTIMGQNTVPSSQVADARIQYVGDGYVSEAQRMGWLQRFFLNVSPY